MRRPHMVLGGIAAVFCLIALVASGDLRAEKPTQTITGIVKSAAVGAGKVRAVYINVPQEGGFLVNRSTETRKELLEHVGATVKATGYVRKRRHDSEFPYGIDVLSFEIGPSSEDTPNAVSAPSEDE
jgi:hypothetical protein